MHSYKLIESDSEFEILCGELAEQKIIGVDLEADSMHCFKEKVCLIQIASSAGSYVVDPFCVKVFDPFTQILENPAIVKVFHGADFDIRSLDRDFNARVYSLFDTEIACRFLGMKERGLAALLKKYFNLLVDKKFQKHDWSKRPLPKDMLAYAATDVNHLIELHGIIKKRLEGNNRLAWAMEEFERQTEVRYENNHSLPLFKRFKGAGKLDKRSLAVLENLLLVRMKRAQKWDLPVFKIISNQSILKMVETRPDTMAKLARTRALSPKQVDRYGQMCVEAIQQALKLDSKDLPKYPKNNLPKISHKTRQVIKNLKIMRETQSRHLGIEPGFLINNGLIISIAVDNPSSMEGLARVQNIFRWQIEAIGQKILNTLEECR
ncbi:MAG: ribonuclease D [Desulfobacteraceae bacterium]|nr:ribonuclease D [Desulfobacteraceae bacterium]